MRKVMFSPSIILASIGAIAYCSWPLAFVMNPPVAHHSLASMLQAPGQPYRWFFVASDTLAAICLTLAGVVQWQKRYAERHKIVLGVIGCYIAFGAFAGVAALTPLTCDYGVHVCGNIWRDPYLIVHGLSSILSTFLLFVGMAALLRYKQQTQWRVYLYWLLFTGWLLFGIASIVELTLHINNNVTQDYFITLCSGSVLFMAYIIEVPQRCMSIQKSDV